MIIFVLTFVCLNLLCNSTGEKLFVVLLTLYKSAEYISEILLHIETYIFACLNERMVFHFLLLFNRPFKSSRSLTTLSYAQLSLSIDFCNDAIVAFCEFIV